jgi:phage baseplate assembly protein W
MSQDFRIAFECPHFTVEEHAQLAEDRRRLLLRQTFSSANAVRITSNDELVLPPTGLFVPARIQGSFSGPFHTIENENTLTVRNNRTEVEGIVLPVGLRVPADDVVTIINNALVAADTNVSIVSNRGILTFTDLEGIGQTSRIEIRGKAAGALGFNLQVGARGSQLYPGWDIVKINPDGDRSVLFREPLRTNSILKVTYAVPGERCLRCRATFVENDYRFGKDGEPILITNEDLLVQASQKIVLTEQGSNPFQTWYGTRIHEHIGMKIIGAVTATIHDDITRALAAFQQLQERQAKVQSISTKERLYTILSINSQNDPNDPTFVTVDVVVSNASGEPISLSIVFTTPGAVALAGSLGQSLGLGV